MKRILFATCAFILIPSVLWGGSSSSKKTDQGVSLVFSSNVQGEVEPCG